MNNKWMPILGNKITDYGVQINYKHFNQSMSRSPYAVFRISDIDYQNKKISLFWREGKIRDFDFNQVNEPICIKKYLKDGQDTTNN